MKPTTALRAMTVAFAITLSVSACGESDVDVSQQNIETVLRLEDEFKNKENYAVIEELVSEDFVFHFNKFGITPDRAGLDAIAHAINGAFPDVEVDFVNVLGDGEFVTIQTSVAGTHTGELIGIPPSGVVVTWTETNVYRLRDGKVVELWPQVDFQGILEQISLAGNPAGN